MSYSNEYNDIHHSEYLDAQTISDNGQLNGVHRNPMMKEGKPLTCLDPSIQTLHDTFMAGHQLSKDSNCLGWRADNESPYQWMTYEEVLRKVKGFGSGLIRKGMKQKEFVGIFSQNRWEWKVTEQSCNSYSMAIVPLYDTLGREAVEYIVSHCELGTVVVDTAEKAKLLLSMQAEGKFKLKLLVHMCEKTEEVEGLAEANQVELWKFDDLIRLGLEDEQDFIPPKPEDLHTICFTSGTTGLPKGAMLSHRNLVSNICGVYVLGNRDFTRIGPDDVHISYLPLAHVFERILQGIVFMRGASVGFFQGDIKLLLSDVGELKPTIFPMVPRLINRMYDKITQGAAQSCLKSFMLNMAKKSKLARLEKGQVTKNTFWDKLVFGKIQKMFGGRVRICLTGAAPISNEVLNFMRCALGVYFSEGYGQTEATCAICVTLPGDYFTGSVGTVAVSNEVKLVNVEEMNYKSVEGKGEVCVRGSNVFMGYYKQEEKTKEALDEDGWLHTGDIGMWMPNGTLKIIDRKKNIFKLSQGEYIAPEKIEQMLVQSTPVAQIFVTGNSLKSHLVAVVVPDAETVHDWLKKKNFNNGETLDEVCKSDEAKKLILENLKEVGNEKGLKHFEIPAKIHLTCTMFSVENNLLTPTFKAKRNEIGKMFSSEIEQMYSQLN